MKELGGPPHHSKNRLSEVGSKVDGMWNRAKRKQGSRVLARNDFVGFVSDNAGESKKADVEVEDSKEIRGRELEQKESMRKMKAISCPH